MTPKLPVCTARELERVLRRLGFLADRQTGSHRIFIRSSDRRRVIVPIHAGDLKPGLIRQILHDLHLSKEEFHDLLRGKTIRRS